jgi:hypothetical protein
MEAFTEASVNNHLKTCKWIHKTFEITSQKLGKYFSQFYIGCIISDYNEMFVWLVDSFGFPSDINLSKYSMLPLCVEFECDKIITFLFTNGHFNEEDIENITDITEKQKEKLTKLYEESVPLGSLTKAVLL